MQPHYFFASDMSSTEVNRQELHVLRDTVAMRNLAATYMESFTTIINTLDNKEEVTHILQYLTDRHLPRGVLSLHIQVFITVNHASGSSLPVSYTLLYSQTANHIWRYSSTVNHTFRYSSTVNHTFRYSSTVNHTFRYSLTANHTFRYSSTVNHTFRYSLTVNHTFRYSPTITLSDIHWQLFTLSGIH